MADNKPCTIGFDLGGTKMMAAVVDEKYNILAADRRKTKPEQGTETGLERMQKCMDDAIAASGISKSDIKGIGIGLPGLLDLKEGRVVRLTNLGWEDIPIRKHFEKIYEAPVTIENDVNTGVYGEYRCGAAKGHEDIVGIFPGTGIGGRNRPPGL